MPERIEVTIKIDDKRITLEGPADFVREEVERLAAMSSGRTPSLGEPRAASAQLTSSDGSAVTERDLVAQKKPTGHPEIVAVLAYCLAKNGQEEFSPEDIRRAYLRASVKPPKVVAQALRDAKNIKDFIVAGKQKGTFRLSPHGERTVLFDLPAKKATTEH